MNEYRLSVRVRRRLATATITLLTGACGDSSSGDSSDGNSLASGQPTADIGTNTSAPGPSAEPASNDVAMAPDTVPAPHERQPDTSDVTDTPPAIPPTAAQPTADQAPNASGDQETNGGEPVAEDVTPPPETPAVDDPIAEPTLPNEPMSVDPGMSEPNDVNSEDAPGELGEEPGDSPAQGETGAPSDEPEDLPEGDPDVDAQGCALSLEGFATLNAMGQDGTTGGQGGQTVTVTNQADLANYASASEPYVIRVAGPITISPKGEEIEVAPNKTIVGVGTSGEIVEGGFILEGSHNVIIRNLIVRDTFVEGDWDGKEQDFDGVQLDQAHHVWIDHCHFHHLGDGIIDSREDTTYLTVSWNILSDHNKAFGIGWTDNVTSEMTIHHNWLRDTGQRNPSTDNVLRAHLYNNWLLRADSYGNYARGGTNMVLENSVFDDVENPYYFDTGSLVAIGNIVRNSSGQEEASGSSYSFFDPHDFYDYRLDPADEVESLLERCAGPRPEIGM